jgi:hypothetical protein
MQIIDEEQNLEELCYSELLELGQEVAGTSGKFADKVFSEIFARVKYSTISPEDERAGE